MSINSTWLTFLRSHTATVVKETQIQFSQHSKTLTTGLYPLPQLALLKVSGIDATDFLQGQLCCDVKKLTANNSYFTAFCNAKGRVISTLLIFKSVDDFFLIVPRVLQEKVQHKLQMYILRSKVTLAKVSDEYCISGFCSTEERLDEATASMNNFARKAPLIKLPEHRYLLITRVEESIKQWTQQLDKGWLPQQSRLWNYLDICSGLAWLDQHSSELYIPQMLNVDKLGGISFDKGCYTGQEIIARTHYLGKSKRELLVVESAAGVIFKDNVLLNDKAERLAKIINTETYQTKQKLLIVSSTGIEAKKIANRINVIK
jgi:folate-binding protein YgfZ